MRIRALLMTCVILGGTSALAQVHMQGAPDGARFQPKLSVTRQAPLLYAVQPKVERKELPRRLHAVGKKPAVEVICGMRVIRDTADADPKIIVAPETNVRAAVRRLQPPVCTSTPKHP